MNPNVQADRFAVLTAMTACHACRASISVSALLVSAHEEHDGQEWVASEDSALLTYVGGIDKQSHNQWQEHAPWMSATASATAGITYLANVCECGALQGDYFLTKPQAPFFPLDEAGLHAIDVRWVDAPIQAEATLCLSSWMDRLIELQPYEGWVPRPPTKARRKRSRSSEEFNPGLDQKTERGP